MIDQFPHAPGAILNTMEAAQRCRTDWDFSRIVFPCFDRMSDLQAYDTLYQATIEGCRRRYGELTREVLDRVAHEMNIIREKNFAHYFLVVADITPRPSDPAAGEAPRHPSSPMPWESPTWTPSATVSSSSAS
jgi:error-prone DNA polymerase